MPVSDVLSAPGPLLQNSGARCTIVSRNNSVQGLLSLMSRLCPLAHSAPCSYCANFTVTQLAPLFKNKLINYVQLDLIPYGNARTDPNTGVLAPQRARRARLGRVHVACMPQQAVAGLFQSQLMMGSNVASQTC